MSLEISPLKPGLVIDTAAARVSVSPQQGRLSLRARGDLTALNEALGLILPDRIGKRTVAGTREAIRLGPDEWTLIVAPDEVTAITEACGALYAAQPHSLVDISARELTLVIEGASAAELLTIGCARDMDSIKPGEGRRTNFDGVTVILRRDADNLFRMDVWNSFASHLTQLLVTGCKELAAELA